MLKSSITRQYLVCPSCSKHEFRVDHLKPAQNVFWCCDQCGFEYQICSVGSGEFTVNLTGNKSTPITVTLESTTNPKITLRLNTKKYVHSQKESTEDFFDHQEYFYNEHTCPTNWLGEVVQIEFEGNTDPHGLFRLVSIKDGHFKDESVF